MLMLGFDGTGAGIRPGWVGFAAERFMGNNLPVLLRLSVLSVAALCRSRTSRGSL